MRQTILSFLFSISLIAFAQEGEYRLADATQLWRLTDNAAGLGLDSAANRGYALFNAAHRSGDYARVQEGTQTNQLRFQTERYQTIGRYLYGYGRFDFDYGRTKDRAWADVMRPYNANPFFSGSAIRGKYDFQDFDFTAALGTTGFSGWRFGLKFDYKTGDLSRLRDPRPRNLLLSYRISPSVTRTFGSHTVGLSGSYGRRKEKLDGVDNEQRDAVIKYYFMTGLENAEGMTNGYSSFWREWVDHRFGGELTYAYRSSSQYSLFSIQAERGEEYAYEQYKYEPGRYVDFQYGMGLKNRFFEGTTIHQVDVSLRYEQAYADQYRQQLHQEKDVTTGLASMSYERLLTFRKRYQLNQFQADLRYRAHFTDRQQEKAYAGAHVVMNDVQQKHLLPISSFGYGGTELVAEGGFSLGKSFWIDAEAGGFVSQNASISLADPTTDYAVNVLLPDMDYYSANYWRGRLQITYQFPLDIKGTNTLWFVRAYGDYLRSNHCQDMKCVGISVGLFSL